MPKKARNYQRLIFIEACLIVRGEIVRAEIDQAFNGSDTNSRLTLRQYKLLCPDNIAEDGNSSSMVRLRSDVFKPVFFDEDMGKKPAQDYLNASHVIGQVVKRAKELIDPEDIPSSFMIHRYKPRKR